MMSSEEDPDLGGGDKKPKRVRQRVDAGEPRNSYASIPNYSPRLYPPNGYGKMLCDLGVLSNGKSSSEMVVLESNGGFGSPERCSSSGGSSDSHLLRDILQQGRHGPVGSPPDFRPPEPHSDDSNDSKASKMSVGGGGVNAAAPQEPPSAGGAADLKRARVETIVSNMMVRTPVNGCKKRKLYQPQQHERPASEEEDEEPCSSPKRRPSSAGLFTFRQQLRHMQQQLVQMQQQYMEMVDGEDSADELDTKPFNDDDSASLYEDSGRKLVVDCDPPKDGGGERQTCIVPPAPVDIGWLAESLKAELSTSLSQVVDAVVSRCVQRKAAACKGSPPTETSTPKDPTLLSQMLDRKSPRTGGKVVDRGARVNGSSPFPADSAPPPPQPPPRPPFLFPLKPSVAATAAFLYGSPPSYAPSPPHDSSAVPEQTEAMSLVVSNKKKRHKVTDTRLNRLCPGEASPKYGGLLPPDPGMYHHHHPPPPPLVPVSLPTTVAIPNPSLNQSELFHGFGGYDPHRFGPPMDDDDGGPPQVPLHALMPFHAGPHHRGSPDQMHPHHLKQDSTGDMSDTGDSPAGYDNGMAMISFLPGSMHTSTLTPMHLRKAKLMFFYARYPSSAVLKMYFPDIRFNKNNTAQLVKWFSNFREFFYIQMEKYARQAITEGVKNAEDLKVDADSELLRVLNLHYNRNNHIPAPHTFRNVVEQTLREFYKALVAGKDSEQSWKKSIYKIIARLDDSVPDYFKSPDFFDKLE